nr:hypothetical protein [Tanacetum cinerariifolium]
MQGQKGAIGSLPESLAMEHGSSSSDAGVVEQQMCWTNFMRSPAANTNDIYLSTANQESQTVSMWSMGESSSSSVPNQMDPKAEHGWSTLMRACPEPQDHEPPPASMLSLGSANLNITHNHANNSIVNPSTFIGLNASSSSNPFEMNERQLPCKRKASELSIGQSSSGAGSSSMFQRPDGSSTSMWRSVTENPPPINSNPSDHIFAGLGLGSSDSRIAENTRRNVRIRINNSRQPDLLPANGQTYPSLGLNPIDLRSPPVAATPESLSSHEGQPVSRVPTLRRNLLASSRYSRSSASRANRSLNVGGSVNSVPASSSAAPNLGPPRGSPHYPSRRLSEILRRSLLSSMDSVSIGGQNSNNLFSRLPPPIGASASSSQEVGMPPVAGNAGPHLHHHPPPMRFSDRQLDGALGFPSLPRAVSGGSERRGRLVSEIRSVLDLIRRGEGLRFEDVMLLDQSVFYGMADMHDRHRDMRLDIDNMSYEELLALEERIGNVNTGLTEENISKCMQQKIYVTEDGQPDAEPCCICQEEYKNGDDLGGLECGHDFHTSCIKKWLSQKNACPVCKAAATK